MSNMASEGLCIKGSHNRTLYIYKNFIFKFRYKRTKNRYYICEEELCKSSVTVDDDNIVIKEEGYHTHPADLKKITALQCILRIRRRVLENLTIPIPQIYNEEVAAIKDVEVLLHMPFLDGMRTSLNNIRAKGLLHLSKTIDEMKIEGECNETKDGQQFLSCDEGTGENRIIITPPPVPHNFMGSPMLPGADGMQPPMMMPQAGAPGMPEPGSHPGPGIPGAGFPMPAFRGMTPVPRRAPSDGNNPKKCRARFGLDQQSRWCKQCRLKRKCIRYTSGSDNADLEENIGSVESVGSKAATPDSRFDANTSHLSHEDSRNTESTTALPAPTIISAPPTNTPGTIALPTPAVISAPPTNTPGTTTASSPTVNGSTKENAQITPPPLPHNSMVSPMGPGADGMQPPMMMPQAGAPGMPEPGSHPGPGIPGARFPMPAFRGMTPVPRLAPSSTTALPTPAVISAQSTNTPGTTTASSPTVNCSIKENAQIMDSADQHPDHDDLDTKKCFVSIEKLDINMDDYDSDSSIDLPPLPYLLNSSSTEPKVKSEKPKPEVRPLSEETRLLCRSLKGRRFFTYFGLWPANLRSDKDRLAKITPPPTPPNFMGSPMRPDADGMTPPMMMPQAGAPGMPEPGSHPGPGIPGAGFPMPAFRRMTPVPRIAPSGTTALPTPAVISAPPTNTPGTTTASSPTVNGSTKENAQIIDSADPDPDHDDLADLSFLFGIKKCFVRLQKLNIDMYDYDGDSSIDLPPLPYLSSLSTKPERKSEKITPPPIRPNFMGGPMRPGADGMQPPMMMPQAGAPGMPEPGSHPGPGIPGAGFPMPAFRGMTPVPRITPSNGNNTKKCPARFGLDQQSRWCKQCRRKKKCILYTSGSDNADLEENIGSVESVGSEAATPDSRFDANTSHLSNEDSGNTESTTALPAPAIISAPLTNIPGTIALPTPAVISAPPTNTPGTTTASSPTVNGSTKENAQTWSDLKYNVRQKACKTKTSMMKTIGDEPIESKLIELETRVLGIIRRQSAEGEVAVEEVGFGYSTSTQATLTENESLAPAAMQSTSNETQESNLDTWSGKTKTSMMKTRGDEPIESKLIELETRVLGIIRGQSAEGEVAVEEVGFGYSTSTQATLTENESPAPAAMLSTSDETQESNLDIMDSADQDPDQDDLADMSFLFGIKKCFVRLQKLNINTDDYDSDASIDLSPLPCLSSLSTKPKRKSEKTTAELLKEHQNLANNLKVDCASNINIDETLKRLEVIQIETIENEDSLPESPVSSPTQDQEQSFHVFLVHDTLQFFNSRDVTPSKCGFENILNYSNPITEYEKEMLSFKRVEFEHVISSFLFSSNTFCISDLKSFTTYLLRNLSIHVDVACLGACYDALISLLDQHPDAKNLSFDSAEIFMILFNYGTDINSFLFLRECPDVLESLEQSHERKKNYEEIPERWTINFKYTLKAMMEVMSKCKLKTKDLINTIVYFLWMTLDSTLHKENLYSYVRECVFVALEQVPEEKWNEVLSVVSKTLLSLEFSSKPEKWSNLSRMVESIPNNSERGVQLCRLISFSALKCLCLQIDDLDVLVFDIYEFHRILEQLSDVDSSLLCVAIKFVDICVKHLNATKEDYIDLLNVLKQCEANISENAHEAKTHLMKIHAKLKIFSGVNVCKTWSDLKYNVQQKASKTKSMMKTGGNEPIENKLIELATRVLGIVGEQSAEGEVAVEEDGFGYSASIQATLTENESPAPAAMQSTSGETQESNIDDHLHLTLLQDSSTPCPRKKRKTKSSTLPNIAEAIEHQNKLLEEISASLGSSAESYKREIELAEKKMALMERVAARRSEIKEKKLQLKERKVLAAEKRAAALAKMAKHKKQI